MDKNVLNLDENEYIVYDREDSYVLYKDEEVELYITNLNLILVNETNRMFKKSTYDIIKWSINDIKVIDNIPQISIEHDKENSYWNIVILFNRGIIKFGVYIESAFKKNEAKKEVEQLADKISQLRLTGTIILKKNTVLGEETNKSFVESNINKFKKTLFGEKISGGINFIKDKVNPEKEEKKKAAQVSQTIETETKPKEANTQPSLDNQFNYCQNCGTKKDKKARFCPSCGAVQSELGNPEITVASDQSISSEDKTIQEIFDTMNEEQKLMVEIMADLARNDITDQKEVEVYLNAVYTEETSTGNTIQEIFDTLSEEQKQAVYAIIGAESEEAKNINTDNYIIRFDTVINRTDIVINGIFIKQLDKNQYYDFNAEVNVRYDIELSTIIFVSLVSKKNISIMEKNSLRNKWIGFGTSGNLSIVDFDMNSEVDIEAWGRVRPKYKKVI